MGGGEGGREGGGRGKELLIIRYDIKYRSKGGEGEGGLEKKGYAIVKKMQYSKKFNEN